MAHAHTADKNYYLDQICALGACAALGVVGILMVTSGKVALILAPPFHRWVFYGGITLLIVVLVRGVALWNQAGRITIECDHDHAHVHQHAEDCDHDHTPAADCGHEHSHAWTPVKYVFLMLPITLYLLELPNAAFSADWANKQADQSALEGPGHAVGDKGTMVLGFRELSSAANESPEKRSVFEGHSGTLKGMFVKTGSDKEFTLMRLKMNCCAADVVPMQVRIISEDKVGNFARTDWVEVTGKVEFRKVAGKDKYYAVLMTDSTKVVKIDPDPTPYD